MANLSPRAQALLGLAVLCLIGCGPALFYLKDRWPSRVQGDSAVEVALTVDAGNQGNTIYPTVYGGNEVLNNVDSLWTLEDYTRGSNLAKMSWRVHTNDDAYGWHWDTNLLDLRTGKKSWCKDGLQGCAQIFPADDQAYHNSHDVVDYSLGNKFNVDYWDSTDMSHSGRVLKVAGARSAYTKLDLSASAAAAYMRFDLKIDSEKTFSSPDSGWEVFRAQQSSSKVSVSIYLTDDRRVDVRCIDSSGGAHQLDLSEPLSPDQYYSIETYYGNNQCAFWLNQNLISQTTLTTRTAIASFAMGAVTSTLDAAGQIHLDAFRADSAYIGSNIQLPWQHSYLATLTFDSNMRTVDDIAQIAARMGATVIWTIPVPNKNASDYVENSDDSGWEWQTLQYYADLVEYLNGTADADYAAKAETLDWTHNTPADNWANLRAARGHVASYNEKYFEIGNEPYYGGGWVDNVASYAQQVLNYGTAFKAIDNRVKIGYGSFFSDWHSTILPVAHDVVDFVSLYHHYAYSKGHSVIEWLAVPLAYGNGWKYYTGNKGDWISAPYGSANPTGGDKFYYVPYLAKAKIQEFLSDRSDVANIFLTATEFGYFLTPGIGDENWWGTAMNRASWLGAQIESGVRFADVWTLFSNRYGMGLLASQTNGIEVTPSFHVYKLFADHFGTKLIGTTFTQNQTPFATGTPETLNSWGFYYPYVSSWSSLNDSKDKMYIIFINRNASAAVTANINLNNFIPNTTADVYTIASASVCDDNETVEQGSMSWWCPDSDGNSSGDHITTIHTTYSGVASAFSYTFEPLSVTALEISGALGTTCVPSCSCAASTCSGQTCSDGCGGTCSGSMTENWSCGSWDSCSADSLQSRSCIDLNSCTINKTESQSCDYISATTTCSTSWNCGSWTSCTAAGQQIRQCSDANSCGTDTDKPEEIRSCTYYSYSSSGGGSGTVYYSSYIASSTSSVVNTTSYASEGDIRKYFYKGRLVKVAGNSAVYHVGSDGKRRLFVNEATFWSWRNGPWANQTVETISQAEFDALPVGKNITVRPGTRLIRFDNSAKIYVATLDDELCYVSTGYGDNWRDRIITIQSSFENDYVRNADCDITATNFVYPDGSLIQYLGSTAIYYIENGKKRLVSDSVFTANGFKAKDIITGVNTTMAYPDGDALAAW